MRLASASTLFPAPKGPTVKQLRRPLALALAAGALTIGVPAAIANGGGDDGNRSTAPQTVQDESNPAPRDRDDCPERGGSGSGSDASFL